MPNRPAFDATGVRCDRLYTRTPLASELLGVLHAVGMDAATVYGIYPSSHSYDGIGGDTVYDTQNFPYLFGPAPTTATIE